LERGEVSLDYEPQHGYLHSVLKALQVPVSSQTLVFAKTSFQFPQISPQHPRALYYNDDVYVGQVYNGNFLEFVSFDARQGPIFYVMDERRSEQPRFERSALDCVQCHVAKSTRGLPGVMLRSVFAKPDGNLAAGAKSFVTGQESPFNERWGGWYLTAVKGGEPNLANATVSDLEHPEQVDKAVPANLTSLTGKVDTSAYLTGTSDIVALLVLTHQTQMHNLITEVSYRTRLGFYAEQQKNKAAVLQGAISEKGLSQFEATAEHLVEYLLFANEVPLEAPVEGNTSFATDFAARGPFDSKGRSLRQFDLRTRVFKYPCSYLIYSESFDALPEISKEYVYRRLFEVLTGQDQSPEFRNLSPESRRAILEILVETKAGLPPGWKHFLQKASF
jgi:hypothetical protein